MNDRKRLDDLLRAAEGDPAATPACRVEAIGGTIRIESLPDAGTTIHVKLPS
jgi:hypothetical protein